MGVLLIRRSDSGVSEGGGSSLDEDWDALSNGARMATRFNEEIDVLAGRLQDSDIDKISWDTSRKWSGAGSMKIDLPSAAGSGTGDWFRHLDDAWGVYTDPDGQAGGSANGTDQGFNTGTVIEIAYAQYITAELRNTVFPGGGGWKSITISHDRGSFQSFEVVCQNTNHRGYPQGYTTTNFTHWDEEIANSGCNLASPDYRHQPSIDHGAGSLTALAAVNPDDGSAWTDCEKAWARYGGLYSYGQSSYQDADGSSRLWKFWEQLAPEGEIGPMLWPEDDWIVLKCRIDLNSYSASTNRIRWYGGRRWHSSWQLLADLQNRPLPTSDNGGGYNIRFNAAWLNCFNTGRTSGGGVSTFTNYGWIVCNTGADSIPFPQVWPANTALEQAFGAMTAGTFADYTSATNDAFSLIQTPGGNILEYGSRGFHDAVNGKLYYLGSDHDGDEKLITLDLASNAWTSEAGPFDGNGFHHSNYMVAMDPATGDLYASEVAGNEIKKKPYGQAWEAIANRPWTGNGIQSLDWNPGLNSGAGGLVFLDSAGIASWNPGTNSWTTLSTNNVSGGYLHMFAFTLDNDISYLGGGNIEGSDITDWWQVLANGTDSQMANDIPIPMGISGKGLPLIHPDGTTALCFGGDTGDTDIREFDPNNAAAGWPVIGTHSLVSNDGSEWKIGIVVRSQAGEEYSGIMFLQTNNANLTFKLYKPEPH